MQADSENAVARTLDERRLYPVRIAEQAVAAGPVLRRGAKVRIRDLAVLYSQMADLLRAGVPILRTLETLSRALANRRLAELVMGVRDDVAQGKTLADAMASRGQTFSPLHVAMVRAGERAGFLEEVLANLGGYLERQDELRSKVRGALIYPMVLTLIGVLAIVGLLMLAVPRTKPLFAKIELPMPTLVMFGLSDLLLHYWMLLLGVIVLAVLGARSILRSEWGQSRWDRLRLRIPFMGRIWKTVGVTRFCRILGTMLANGVPILQALTISRDAVDSPVMAQAIDDAADSVKAGEGLSDPLGQSGLFPPEIVEMISIAEESNMLEKTLVQIADTVDRRTDRQVDAAVRLIEPIILVMLAVAIGFMAVGILYPIFTLGNTIR